MGFSSFTAAGTSLGLAVVPSVAAATGAEVAAGALVVPVGEVTEAAAPSLAGSVVEVVGALSVPEVLAVAMESSAGAAAAGAASPVPMVGSVGVEPSGSAAGIAGASSTLGAVSMVSIAATLSMVGVAIASTAGLVVVESAGEAEVSTVEETSGVAPAAAGPGVGIGDADIGRCRHTFLY